MLIDETYQQQCDPLDGNTAANNYDDLYIQLIKDYHNKNEFLYKWFEVFHFQNGLPENKFSTDLLFNDNYLLQILSIAIPNSFEPPTQAPDNNGQISEKVYNYQKNRVDSENELNLFSQLKQFYKDREVDLTEVLKQIRIKKQSNKQFDFQSWEKAYWQLIQIIFTAFFIENSQNEYLEGYFQIQLRVDLKQMRMVLDITSQVFKKAQTPEQEVTAKTQQIHNNSNIMILNQKSVGLVSTQNAHSYQNNQDSHYVVQVSDIDHLRRLTESSEGSLGTEEDDDDLLKEDVSNWDVFDDYHKFQVREQRMKERQKKIAQDQKRIILQQKDEEIEMQAKRDLEKEIEKLENKVRIQEETLKKKNEKEIAMMNELNIYESKVQIKQLEIENLHQKMILYETFKHKFEVKKHESDMLLHRLEELSQSNGTLEDQVIRQRQKNYKLERNLEELKEKIKQLKTNGFNEKNDLESLEAYDFESQKQEVKIKVLGYHSRVESIASIASTEEQRKNQLENSLKCELQVHAPGQNHIQTNFDDDEPFDSENTFRTQYRFETTDDDLMNSRGDLNVTYTHDYQEQDPYTMDNDLLRSEYSKEQHEKLQYKNLYHELQERCFHYQQMMTEYERLYTEFLTKSIRAEKEKMELQKKIQRINWIQGCVDGVSQVVQFRNISQRDLKIKLCVALTGALILAFIILLFIF